jgi:chemotaxis protein MotB
MTSPVTLAQLRQRDEAKEKEKEKELVLRQSQQEMFQKVAQKMRQAIASFPEFSKMQDQIDIKITDDGLRIELLEKSESMFFDVGAATLKPKTQELLGLMTKMLGDLPNRIAVEGHTDSRPYPNQNGYTNWELSSDRANAARRFMQGSGLHDQQISEVRGYADTQLRTPGDPNDISNRRISIIVLYNTAASEAGAKALAGSMAPSPLDASAEPGAPGAAAPGVPAIPGAH